MIVPVASLPFVPGLLRRGARIVVNREVSGFSMNDNKRSGTPIAQPGTYLTILDTALKPIRPFHGVETGGDAITCAGIRGATYVCPPQVCDLDLEDEVSRACAVRWLARQAASPRADAKGLREITDVDNMHPLFVLSDRFDVTRPCTLTVQEYRHGGAALRLDQGAPVFVDTFPIKQNAHAYCHMDHGFDVNPRSTDRLADGSLWVEAEVLRLAVLHVARRDDR